MQQSLRAAMLSRSLPAALLTAIGPPSRSTFVRLVHTEKRIAELGITLPPPGGPKANYNVACFESPTLVSPMHGRTPASSGRTFLQHPPHAHTTLATRRRCTAHT